MKNQKFIFSLLLVIFLIGSCKTKTTKEIHPFKNRIPNIENEHILVAKNGKEEISLSSRKLISFKQILKTKKEVVNRIEFSDLTLSDEIKIISINKDRFLILDINEDRLVEYNLKSKEKTVLAKRGHGPGDLFLSSDMNLFNKELYISNKDGRIFKYNCNKIPCDYINSIHAKRIVPYSLTNNVDELILLGASKLPSQRQPISDTEIDNTAMWVYDYEGVLKESFGKYYDVDGHWMLQKSFSDGVIEYAEESKNYFSAFHRLPLIYVYDQSYTLVKTFKFSDFLLGEQEYEPKTGRLSVVQNGFSTIEEVEYISGNIILVVVKTLTNRRTVNKMYEWDVLFDYYALDSQDFSYSFLGSDSTSTKYFLTSEHVFFRPKNKLLYKINNQ